MSILSAAFFAALVILAPLLGNAEVGPGFEQPHAIPLSRAVPESKQSGPGYRIGETVFANGFSQDYVLVTDEFGEYMPTSDYLLDVRINEVRALQELAGIRKSEAYIVAVAKAGAAPLYLLKDLATRPVQTVTGVPKGIWRAGTKAVRWLGGDRRLRADTEDSATREAIGVSRRKREFAARLVVDPYSSNLVLQDELDRVSWASFAGGLSVTVAMAAAGLPPAAALTYRVTNLTRSTNELATSVSGGDLYRRNRDTLHEIGLSEEQVAAFLENTHLSPSRKTAITLALETLKGKQGLEHIVALGAEIETEDDAVRLQRTAELMSGYHQANGSVDAILRWDNHLFVKEQTGDATAVVPADRMLWTLESRSLADAMRVVTEADAKLSIQTTGVFSDTARNEITERGISLGEGIEF